jgi:hypothetical protein
MALLVEHFLSPDAAADPIAVERFVRARVDAMPWSQRAGVQVVELLLAQRLRLVRDAASGRSVADGWTRSGLPGVAEYVRLVRSLAVVCAFDGSTSARV